MKLSELNKICQKPDYRTVGNRMVRYFERPAALYITWVLIHTPVTAHQVTFIALSVAVAGAICFTFGTPGYFLVAVLLWQFWYLLDHVDGQIARYRRSVSLEGVFYDFVMHHVVNLIMGFAIGYGCYRASHKASAIILGFITSFSLGMTGLLSDCEYKAACSLSFKQQRSINIRQSQANFPKKKSFPRMIFSLLHKSCEGHVVMNVFTLYALFYFWFSSSKMNILGNILWGLLAYYAAVASLVWISKLTYRITSRHLSHQYKIDPA